MSKVTINIRVEQDMKEKLTDIGKQLGLSEADVCRMAFAEYIQNRIHLINKDKNN
jgi:antitoxin component of RelBE/YafQ-DinJ toxin-antitoxin module